MSKKNHKKKRKIGTYALASAMVLSNLAFVAPTSAATYKPGDLASKVKQLRQLENAKLSANKLKDKAANARANLKASDKVRVIVEVDGQTPIEYATKEGKLFKELSEEQKATLFAKVDSQQKAVKEKIQAKGVGIKYKQKFSTAFNGFSGEVNYGDVDKIESIAGVKNVYLANEYNRPVSEPSTPDLTKSHQFIQSKETWKDLGIKGQGMVISIIDTGIDPTHRDFKLTDTSKEDLTKTKVDGLVQEKGLPGHFFTDKVPYGYNYYDQNDIIKDTGPTKSMHGMHVAGITAANGDEANGGVKGVAPEAQVLAMKVFSNDPDFASTWSDVYLAAIDDSIKLGADVLNMSLGSTASFYDENSAEDVAITRAVDNGVVCAVSSGNSNQIGSGWYGGSNPFSQNPDIGVTGAPGLNKDTISVAASGNEAYLYENAITVDGDDSFNTTGYGLDDWSKLASDNIVSLGGKLGYPEDYNGVDVQGKVVLVKRGDLTFADKTKYAAQAGAAGIIVYNKVNDDTIPYKDQGGWEIPIMIISGNAGTALEASLAGGHTAIHVNQTAKNESPEMGRMTSFTSWGVTPSLELKPEITAPGGNIYSTVNDNKYEVMSGTSMAAPHVAGGSALVQEYLQNDQRFSQLSVSERTHLAKVLLMNTARVINDLDEHPYSPRRQGAGMMQIENAVTTPAYFVNKATGEAKVELKDFQSKQYEMNFTVNNISDKSVMYKVDTTALTDEFYQVSEGPERNALQTGALEGAKIDAPDSVIVPAGQSVDFTVKVDLSNAKIPGIDVDGKKVLEDLHDNIFVEGSVNLIGSYGNPNLTVPYVGFYGKWDSPQIVDGFKDLGEDRYYDLNDIFGMYGLEAHDMTSDGDNYFLPVVPGKNFYPVSPNNDGYTDDINPLPSFLRNASQVQYNILDKDGKFLRRVSAASDVTKDAFDSGHGSFVHDSSNTIWDGKVNGETVKDGLYYYEIKSVIDYAGAKWQSKKVPVYVDTTAPKVQATFDPEKKVVSWNATDDGTGVQYYAVYVNGELAQELDNTTTSYDLSAYGDGAVVEVVAVDYAWNAAEDTAAIGDVSTPAIYFGENSPVPYGTYNQLDIPVEGYVTDDIGIKTVKVNGKEVETSYDPETGHYNYSTTATFDKDGYYTVQVEATDFANKSFSIARKIFVDTTGPVINVDAPERVNKDVDSVTLNVNLQDNFNYLNFYVNDNHEFEVPFKSPVDVLTPLNKDYQVTVPLKEGENTIVLRATDLSGNETVKELVINRADEVLNGWVQEEDGTVYYYDEDGSKHKGWLTEGSKEDGYYWKYYFDPDTGAMHTGWLELDGNRYYFDESGVMATDVAYVQEAKNFFYFDQDGVLQSGFQEMYGEKAYFDAETGLFRGGWKNVDGKWIYAESTGLLHTGWLNVANKWYFFNQKAEMQTGWVNDGKSSYFMKDSGEMATGWAKVDGKWYFFNSQGSMVTGWVKDGRTWYYLDRTGVMKTGWLLDGGKWYYLNSNGSMYNSGWKLIGGKWYYFYGNGSMAANTTIGKDRVGKDGAWIKK